PRNVFLLSQDLYLVIMSCALVWCYVLAFNDASAANRSDDWSPILIACCAFSFLRVYELFGVTSQLHSKSIYKTKAPMRAILNTIWHYGELAVAFAVFYVAAAAIQRDSFGERGLLSSGENPVYFSFVMITTISCGDFS